MSDLAQITALLEKQGKDFEAFKAANDTRLEEIDKKGTASAEQVEIVNRLNAELTNTKAQIAELENRMARPAAGDSPDPKAPEATEKKAEFFNYMRGRAPTEIRAALVEDATGEILVPEDIDNEIRLATQKLTIMRQLARVRTTTSNRIRRRSLNELTVGWGKLELGDPLVEGTLTPAQDYLYVEDLRGLTKIGEDELMDTDVNLEQQVEDSFGRAIANAEDLGYTLGTGHANDQPQGALSAGNGVARVTAGQIAAVTVDDFIRLAYAVPAQYRRNGAFLLSSSVELSMRLLKDANGLHLWQPSVQAGKPATFAGYPVYNQEDIPAVPTALAAAAPVDVAAFGDFKVGYVIVDRLGTSVKRLGELYSTSGMVGFLVHRRTTGGISVADALRILSVPRA